MTLSAENGYEAILVLIAITGCGATYINVFIETQDSRESVIAAILFMCMYSMVLGFLTGITMRQSAI